MPSSTRPKASSVRLTLVERQTLQKLLEYETHRLDPTKNPAVLGLPKPDQHDVEILRDILEKLE